MESLGHRHRPRALSIVVLLLAATLLATPAAADPPPGVSEVTNVVCSTWNDTDGICDDYDFGHDLTSSQEWVHGRYLFDMQSTDSVTLTLEWEVHEFNRSRLGLQDMDLGGNYSMITSGAPADYIRNYLVMQTIFNMSVRNLMLQEISDSVEELVRETYGGEVDSIQTDFVDQVTMNNVQIECTEDPDSDSADELASLPNNAFQPPICLRTTANIRVDAGMAGFGNDSELDIERTYQGLLTMGGAVTTNMSLFSPAGHESTFEVDPPSYGTIESVDGGGSTPIRQDGPFQYKIGSWTLSNLDAAAGSDDMLRDVSMTTTSRDAVPRVVRLDLENAVGLEASATLDLRDEMANQLTLEIGMHYLPRSTLDAWGIDLMGSNIDLPWVTSDGFRLAYHNGLIDLDDFSDAIPLDTVNDTIQQYSALDVNMGPLTWLDFNSTGGLNFSYIPGQTCAEGTPVNYCLQGSNAMNGTYPVYMTSVSDPFVAEPMAVLNDLFEQREGFPDLSSLTTDDLAAVLSVLQYEFEVNTSFIEGLIPDDLPPTDVSLTVILPEWVTSTTGDPSTITFHSRVGESEQIPVGVTGQDPYHARWSEAICESSAVCTDSSPDLLCHSTWKTCISITATLDFSELNVREWSRAVELVVGGSIRVELYRLEVPEPFVDLDGLTIEAIPSDLLRYAISVGDQTEGGLSALFDENLTVPIGDADHTLELSNSGLQAFADELASYMTDEIQAQELNEDDISMDFAGLRLYADVDPLERPPDTRIDDDDPLGITLDFPPTSISAAWTDNGLSVSTAAQSLMLALLSGITQSIGGGAFTFPEEPTVVRVDPVIIQHDLDETYDSDGDGVADNDVDIEVRPAVTLDLLLPVGLTLDLESAQGNDEYPNRQDGRQQIIYRLPLCVAEESSQCDAVYDEVSFSITIGYDFIFKELLPYLLAVGGLILLLLFARKRKRREKEKMLEEKRQAAKAKTISHREVEQELAGVSPTSSAPAGPTKGADAHWLDGIDMTDDDWSK